MSFWGIMNWVAWGLCALIIILITKDVIGIETKRTKTKNS